jgi:metallo-beta-lactamase family protein
VLLTHAHIDHSGLLPKLTRFGFEGTIHATPPTVDLCSVMLPDSGNIQESEVERLNRRNRQRGKKLVEPIYTLRDALACMDQFQAQRLRNLDRRAAGHPRALLECRAHAGLRRRSRFMCRTMATASRSGCSFPATSARTTSCLQPDPEAPSGYDYLLCESTFGATDRATRLPEARRAELGKYVSAAAQKRGALLIPSFAVERTQEVLTDLMLLMNNGEVPAGPVFIDSPLARKATEIFKTSRRTCWKTPKP